VVAVQIGLRLLYGLLSFEQALFILLLAPEFYLPLRLLGARFHAGMAGVAAAEQIFEVLAVEPAARLEAETWTETDNGPEAALARDHTLQFHDVYYAYEAGQRPALNGLSFALSPGEKVALVGPTGAGKSTVAYLLLRFIEPDRGTIAIGDLSLGDLALPAWRNQVAWVPQSPHLFHGTVAENNRMAGLGPLRRVVWAARQATLFHQAHPKVRGTAGMAPG
jgi:ATP-binding cassette subfamily C protein CydD